MDGTFWSSKEHMSPRANKVESRAETNRYKHPNKAAHASSSLDHKVIKAPHL